MNKHHLLSLIAGSAVLGSAFAGTSAPSSSKAPVAPTPIVEESSLFSGSVTLGYDTDYVFRGFEVLSADGEQADNLVWGALDLNAALSDKLALNFNTWYASSGSANYDELNVYTRLTYNLGPISVGPSFKWYNYPQYPSTIDNQYEAGLEVFASPVDKLALSGGAFYEFESEQWYFQVDANYTVTVNDMISLVPGATLSYVDIDSPEYFTASGFHHSSVYLKAPIKVAANVTLTPYIAVNIPLGDLEDEGQDERVYGGASLSVSF